MLRLVFLLLLLANAGYYAWSQGLLAPLGLAPNQQREPQRVAAQIQPESVVLVSPAAPAPGRPDNGAGEACLQAGLFDQQQVANVRALLQGLTTLPQDAWRLEPGIQAARWMIYMGKYPDEAALDKKMAELRRINVAFDVVANGNWSPGLVLGSYASSSAANTQLDKLVSRGVATARVVAEPEARGSWLKLTANAAAVSALGDRIEGLPLLPCR